MKVCTDCGSEIKLGKEECSVCLHRNFQEKTFNLSIKTFDYHIILDALEIAIKSNINNIEKVKEFREVMKNLNQLSKNFELTNG